MELRTVNPRTLRFNPNNPRRTPSSPEADAMLDASITALGGLIQPPVVHEDADGLEIKVGERRVRAVLRLGFPEIPVLVAAHDEKVDAMGSVAENTARAPLGPVDQWRAIETLVSLDWTEEAIGAALALPVRTIQKLRRLAHILPAMLDRMAKGDMPDERSLRVIAAAAPDEQSQVWKKRKPKKNERVEWHAIAQALDKRRIPAANARFGDDLAQTYGIAWEEDLFQQAGEDNRYTTNVEGFFGAQQEWLANNLPENGVVLTINEWGRPVLPKGAEQIWSKPGKRDRTGWYINPHSGAVESVAYRMAETRTGKGNGVKDEKPAASGPRPPLTQKGAAMLGDLRTDALHQAVREAPADAETLLALLVLAFSAQNVSVTSASTDAHYSRNGRAEIAAPLVIDGGVTRDGSSITAAARAMLADVLSCRENASRSGIAAKLAGVVLRADDYLPSLATEDFVACLSREQVEQAARDAGVPVRPKLKETRAGLIAHYAGTRFLPDLARFQPTPEELAAIETYRSNHDEAVPPPEDDDVVETGVDVQDTLEADGDRGPDDAAHRAAFEPGGADHSAAV